MVSERGKGDHRHFGTIEELREASGTLFLIDQLY